MAAYLLVLGKGTDRDRMAAYSRALPPVYAAAGGRYLAIGGPGRGVDWLAGPWRDRSLVLARFDDLERVRAFWWGAAYREAARLREAAGQFTVVGLPGLDESGEPASADAVYLVEVAVTRDAQAYADYRSAFAAAAAPHGARALAATGAEAFVALEGDPMFDRVAVTVFPSAAAFDAFAADARTAPLDVARDRAGLVLVARANAAAAPAPSITQPTGTRA